MNPNELAIHSKLNNISRPKITSWTTFITKLKIDFEVLPQQTTSTFWSGMDQNDTHILKSKFESEISEDRQK